MSYAAQETSRYAGRPYELYWFSTATQQWRLTSSDQSRSYNGAVFEPVAMTRTATAQGSENASGEVKITIPRDHEIAGLFAAYLPSTPLSLVIYRGHDGDPDSEVVVNFTGRITVATFGNACELTAAPEQEILKRTIPGPVYQTPCNRILYDAGCTVDKNAFKVQGTLSSVADDTIQSPAFAAKPDGWFNAGYVEFGTERRMILSHAGDTLTLIEGIPDLAAGDEIAAYAGCNRAYDGDCVAKFNNGQHFFGFEWIPAANPFKGSLT